jgi:hypothetical protein
MGSDGRNKTGSTAVLVGVILIAFFVNGKQLAGWATGADEPLPAGCEEQAQPGMDELRDDEEAARQKAQGSAQHELGPDFNEDIVDHVVVALEDVGIL